ncbi:hypothetical protein TNCV_518691 [Trichonephila clavipes]|nr:hypothetical protein TNCV_518691 [Trichonephila clavipes]
MTVRQTRTVLTISLSTNQRNTASSTPTVVPSIISQCLAETRIRSQRPLKPLASKHQRKSSGVVSQQIVMVALTLGA